MALDLNFGVRQKVYGVYVQPNNILFIQPDTDEAYGLNELSNRIQVAAKSGQLRVGVPKVGQRCCALSETDGVWYRAITTKCDGSSVSVYYVDYGNTEQISSKNVYEPSENLFNSAYQAIQCVLSDFIPTANSTALNSKLQELITSKELYAIVQSRCSDPSQSVLSSIPCYNVTLFENEDSTVSLSKDLTKDGLGQFRICSNHVEIGKKYSVFTSFDDSPGKFWVQFSEQSDQLQQLMDALNSEQTIASLKPLPFANVSPGVACTCLYEDGCYYRAEIVTIHRPDKINICFVDYGNCVNVAATEIKAIPAHLAMSPLFAVQCCLEGIKPIKPARPDPILGNIAWTKPACEKFNQLTQNVEFEVHVVSEISPEIFSVHLQDVAKAEDMGAMLCKLKIAQVAVPKASTVAPQETPQETPQEYQYLELESNKAYKNMFISYTESPAVVWCQPAREPEKFEAAMSSLLSEAPSLPPLRALEVDLPCCVLYDADESWCRGCIQSIDNSTQSAKVLFVDYGNVESVKFANIKTLPSKYFSFPAQAVSFSVADISPRGGQTWSKEANECFQEMITERYINCKIVGMDADGYPAAKLYDPHLNNANIALELVNRGYAKMPLTASTGGDSYDASKSQSRTSSSFSSSNASSPAHSQKGRSHDLQKASPSPSPSSRHSSKSRGTPQSSPFHNKQQDSFSPKHQWVKLQAGQSVMATVYHVNSPTEFYIQLKSSTPELEELMMKVETYCQSHEAKPLRSPSQRLPVLAQYAGDGCWYRAFIISAPSSNGCVVVFADFGNTETVPLSNLVQIPSKFLELPFQAIRCCLSGVSTSRKCADSMINAFGRMAMEQDFKVLVKQTTKVNNKETHAVDLVTSTGDSVLNLLVQQGAIDKSFLESSPSPSPRSPSKVAVANVPLPKFQANQPLDVVISYTESPSMFSLQLADSYSDLQKLSDDLCGYYSQLLPKQEVLKSAQVGSFCAAQFSEDQLWYRGRVTKVSGSKISVTFIDFGNSEDQNLSALKVLKPEFCKIPCISIPCRLAGLSRNEEYNLEAFTEFSETKLVGIFEQPFNSYGVSVAVKLMDTSKSGADVNILDSIRVSANSSVHIPEVTPVSNCPMESTVSYIANPEELYCQLSSEKDVFDALMNKMYAFYGESREGSPVLSPKVGSYCASLYSDGSWYRGRISSISPKGVTVLYLDYGNSESVESSSLRALEPEFYSLPIQAMKCHIGGVEPPSSDWGERAVLKIQDFLLEKNVEAIYSEVKGDQGYAVQLILDGEDFTEVLHREGLARVKSASSPNKASVKTFSIPPYPIRKGEEYHVLITSAVSPLEVYAQILDVDEKLDGLMQELAQYCTTRAAPKQANWKPGDHILAQFTEDQCWYRGRILNVTKDKDKFKVMYLDYGNSELLPSSCFREMKPDFCVLPAQAVKCRVEGAQYYKYTPESTQEFNNLLIDQEFQMRCLSVSEDTVYAVDLIGVEDSVDVMSLAISKNIVQAKISTVSAAESNQLCTHVFPAAISLDTFHDVMVVYAESPSNFFCQFSLNSIQALDKLVTELNEFYASAPRKVGGLASYKIGEFVAAQFSDDESWYRAVITDIKGDTAAVIFVDYGNSDVVVPSKLRKLATQFVELPAQAVPCCLTEVVPVKNEEWCEEAIAEFSKLTVEHSFVAQMKSSHDLSGKLFKFGDGQRLEVALIDAEISKSSPAEELVTVGLALPSETQQEEPASIQPVDTSTPFVYPALQPGDTHDVFVSFVESPSRFWLQLASSEETLAAIQENMNIVYSEDPNKLPYLVNPVPGATCSAKFSQDGNWYRGTIQAKHPNGVEVLFVDYGNSEIVPLSDVCVIQPALQAWETQAFSCSLHGCHSEDETGTWDDNAIGIFSELVTEKPLRATIVTDRGGGCWNVRIRDGDSEVCDQLIQCGVAIRVRAPAEGVVVTPKMSQVNLSVGQEYSIYIAYIDSPSNFFCQLSSDYDKLESLMAEIADFYNENHLEPLLEVGAYCVAQYSSNHAWYRARIISITRKEISVNFIDYGNSEIVEPSQILALESQFTSLPAQAMSCSIVENENYPLAEDVLDRFIEYDLNQDFTISVSSITPNGQYFVKLYDQEGGLVNESLYSPQPVPASVDTVPVPPAVSIAPAPAIQSYLTRKYPAGKSVDVFVSHIVSPNSFFCQPLELAGELEDMMTDIGSYMNSESYEPLPQESLQSGMVCLGQYTEDKDWYRGLIEEVISGSNALVNFVDYGNKEVLSLDRISVLPKSFAKLPLQCFHCSIVSSAGGDSSWNVDQVEHFRSLVPDTEQFSVKITDFDVGKNRHLVQLYRNDLEIDLTPLLTPKVDGNEQVNVSDLSRLVVDRPPLAQMRVDNSNLSMIAMRGSKTPSRESGSDNGESETTDDGSEGKLLIKAPFKLSLAVQEALDVSVVFIESPSLIYIQRADCKTELDNLSEEIAQHCASFEEGRNFPLAFCEGDIVLAKWSEDELWYRGEIIGVDSGSDGVLKISFIDYGNVEVISSDSVVMCPKNFLELPAQAIPCSLAQVPHRDSWPLSYKDLITELVKDKVMQASVVLPGSQGMKPTVKLEDPETNLDISQSVLERLQEECEGGSNEVIAEEDEEELREEEEEAKKDSDGQDDVLEPESTAERDADAELTGLTGDLEVFSLPDRDNTCFLPGSTHQVSVIACPSPHSLVCQLSSEVEALEEVTKRLSELYEVTDATFPTSVTEGLCVAAQFSEDGLWYRAKVVSCSDQPLYKVLYVDFGNSELVPLESLRRLDETLALCPPFAVSCSLDGIEQEKAGQEYPTEMVDRLGELCGGGEEECTMEVVSVDSTGCCSVVLTSSEGVDIAGTLIEENLVPATSTSTVKLESEPCESNSTVVESASSSSTVKPMDGQSMDELKEEEEVVSTPKVVARLEMRGEDDTEEEGHISRSVGISSAEEQATSPHPIPAPSGNLDIKVVLPKVLQTELGFTPPPVDDLRTSSPPPITPSTSPPATPTVTPPTSPPTTPPTSDLHTTPPATTPLTSPPITPATTPPCASPPPPADAPIIAAVTPPPITPSGTPPPTTPPGTDSPPPTTPPGTGSPPPATSPGTGSPPPATPPGTDSPPPPATPPGTDSPPPTTPPGTMPPSDVPDPCTPPPATPPNTDLCTPPSVPTVAPTAEYASQYLSTTLALGSHHSVRVAAVSSLEDFTCQLMGQQDQLQELMTTIASRKYRVGVEDDLCPKPALPVCACSTKGDVWQRGLILSTGQLPNTYTVLYVDYGNMETLSAERIKPLEACFATCLPPQSIKCSLPVLLESDMNPDLPSDMDAWELNWPTCCITLFKKLVNEDAVQFSVEPLECREDNTYVVRLYNEQLDVRKALVTNLQDPSQRVIKEAVVDSDASAGKEDTDAAAIEDKMSNDDDDDGGVEKRGDERDVAKKAVDGDVSLPTSGDEGSVDVVQGDMSGCVKEEVGQDVVMNGGDSENVTVAEKEGYLDAKFEVGDEVNLIYLFGSSLSSILCQFYDDSLQLEILGEEIARYVSSLESAKPCKNIRVGDCLLAKASKDGVWYRGEVVGCTDPQRSIQVLYVDYGDMESLSVTDTLPIPAHFTTLRKQAVTYQLYTKSGDRLKTWPDEAFSKFEDLVQFSEYVVATVMCLEGDRVIVSMKSNSCTDFAENIQQ